MNSKIFTSKPVTLLVLTSPKRIEITPKNNIFSNFKYLFPKKSAYSKKSTMANNMEDYEILDEIYEAQAGRRVGLEWITALTFNTGNVTSPYEQSLCIYNTCIL